MSFWFNEKHSKNLNFSIKVSEQICSIKSKYQKIEIFNSEEFGKILVLDGYLMLTEKDEFIYHEMLTHVPMAIKNCEKILIIGGGDGGILFQLSKYKFVKKIDIVEIDELVVKTSKENFSFAKAFDDPRINISFSDGMKYIRSKKMNTIL